MKEIIGNFKATDKKISIVVARFNSQITERLLEGAVDCLQRHWHSIENVTVVRVPGAFEIPLACQKICAGKGTDAVIALGCVIRGETPHFDYVSSEVTKGVAHVSLQYSKPIAFGVLTTDNVDQAMNRAGIKNGNKGFEAALTVIEMLNLVEQL